ncbi:uncharacterized protein LOC126884738 isoform X2 [Diabrotica virgifera virgifera]|uniref:Uncharacterized protein n=1 Tax=Diabrotica virgifera virgifera TaxID=50390 RepID=A0ABM5K9I2_DIAVI|nr:uncharacterized protein LOC126884738 isoform X1 [Diabrotica virgifera virgifera]XP_050506849.1 uncharacterized protein LOC126884738 isoform X2 [Diabrotica virgifera virgifera]
MAFVCPPKEFAEQKLKDLRNIRDAIETLEKSMVVGVKPLCVPTLQPIADYPTPTKPCNHCCAALPDPPPKPKQQTPDVMVCYKICPATVPEPEESPKIKCNGRDRTNNLKATKSRELRAGILYTGCDCCKWAGLQDDCPRTGCHGSPECLTNPPTCSASRFCYGKHLGKKKQKKRQGRSSSKPRAQTKQYFKCFPAIIQDPLVLIEKL